MRTCDSVPGQYPRFSSTAMNDTYSIANASEFISCSLKPAPVSASFAVTRLCSKSRRLKALLILFRTHSEHFTLRSFLLLTSVRIHGMGDQRAKSFDRFWKGSSPMTQDNRMWSLIACISSASPLAWALNGRLKATSPRISRTKYEIVDLRSNISPVPAKPFNLLTRISM